MELKVNVHSAKDLKNVNIFSVMKVYAVVSINATVQRTPIDLESGSNPEWNYRTKFIIDEADIHQNTVYIIFDLKSNRMLGDRDVGTVQVPLKALFDQGNHKVEQHVSYSVMLPNGKSKGVLNFSYKFEENLNNPPRLPATEPESVHEGHAYPMAYPPESVHEGHVENPGMAYPPESVHEGHVENPGMAYPPPPPYPQGYGGYVPPPGPYPPPLGIAGYHYQPPHYGSYPQHYHQQDPSWGHGYHHQPHDENGKPPNNIGMGAAGVGLGIAAAGGVAGGLL